MDDSALVALLKRLDDPEDLEYPTAFDRGRAERRFRKFVRALETELGTTLAIQTSQEVQDTSFHGAVSVSSSGSGMPWLRFSNFGDLAAIGDTTRSLLRCWPVW